MCSTHLIRFQIAGAFCLFVYDSMLTFPSEYEYIWKARPSWGKVRKSVAGVLVSTLNENGVITEALPHHTLWRPALRDGYDYW